MVTPSVLSKEDISRLMEDRSTKSLMQVAEKLSDQYVAEGKDALSPQQTAIANDIIRLLLSRAEVTVRAMLSMSLSQADTLPKDLALKMAQDVNEVASSVLRYSDVLDDDDLTGIINSIVDTEKLNAIAKRQNVSEAVTGVLVNTSQDAVVNTLMQNESARINAQSFEKIIQHHSNNPEVVESILQRSSIPVSVVEKVINHLSVPLRQNLEKKYGNLTEMKEMKKSLEQSLELASIKMMGFKSSDKELMHLLDKLGEDHKLSPFSALSMGNLQLFEVSMSRLLRIPFKNVHTLLQDAAGFKVAYVRAGLPENMFDAVELAVRAIRSLEADSKEIPNSAQVMERMRQLSAGRKVEGAESLYAMMQHCV
jgi:uncharacterized protein (DUF2336 family)